jgi:hypothetical protein
VDIVAARRYYARQGFNARDVDRKIAEKEIHVGELPTVPAGGRRFLDADERWNIEEMKPVKYTKKQKDAIRAWWSYMPLRFRADGSVEGKKGNAWGVLYTADAVEKDLKALGLL